MFPTAPPPIAAPPHESVASVLETPGFRDELFRHACAAFQKLLNACLPAQRRELAEDAVQDALQRALKIQSRFDPTTATAAAWVHGILTNVCFEHARRHRKLPVQPCSDPAAWDTLAAHLDSDHERAELDALLARLPDDQRQLVVWHHLDELSHAEIAARLRISVGCCRVRLCRAILALKQLAQVPEGMR